MPFRKETGTIRAPALPAPSQFRHWKLTLRDHVDGASGALDEGFRWILGIESSRVTTAMPYDSGSSPAVDAKLAAALSGISWGEMLRSINNMKEQMAPEGKLMKKTEIIFEVCKHYQISETRGSILDFRDRMQVKLQNHQPSTLLNDSEYILVAKHKLPPGDSLESLSMDRSTSPCLFETRSPMMTACRSAMSAGATSS